MRSLIAGLMNMITHCDPGRHYSSTIKKGTLCHLKSEACIEICHNAGSRCVGIRKTIVQYKIIQHLEIDLYF